METDETGLVAPDPPTGEGRAERYPLIQYGSERMAREAFLDAYFGDAGYDRRKAAEHAGLAYSAIAPWFGEASFIDSLEARLQATVQVSNDLQSILIDQSKFIMEGNIADIFEESPNGNLIIKNIKSLPRHISACIKQMDVIRSTQPGPGGRPEYVEGVRVVLHDKTKVMNILADLTDIKNKAFKNSESGAPRITGLSLITAKPKGEEDADAHDRKVLDEQEAEGGNP